MNGSRLKELRQNKECKISDLSELLGVSVRTYQSYEREERDISTDNLAKLVNYLNVSSDYIIGVSDSKKRFTANEPLSTDVSQLRDSVLQAVVKITSPQSLKLLAEYAEYLACKE